MFSVLLWMLRYEGLHDHWVMVEQYNQDSGSSRANLIAEHTIAWPALQLDTNQSLQIPVADLVSSAFDSRVYVSIPANGGSLSNTVTAVDPMTGDLGLSIPVGNNPDKLAVSDDGQFVYVVSGDGNRIDRINLGSGTVSLSFTLGNSGSGPIKATDVAVMPGQPGTIAIACGDGIGKQEVRIYDGSTARAQKVTGSWVTAIEFGATASILYGLDSWTTDAGFYIMAVGTDGVTLNSSLLWSPFDQGGDIACADGAVFSTSKGVFDPTTSRMRFPFYGGSGFAYYAPLVVDASARRVCYILPKGSYYENFKFQVFSLDTFLPVGEITIPSPPGYFTGTLIRWGADGLVDPGQHESNPLPPNLVFADCSTSRFVCQAKLRSCGCIQRFTALLGRKQRAKPRAKYKTDSSVRGKRSFRLDRSLSRHFPGFKQRHYM